MDMFIDGKWCPAQSGARLVRLSISQSFHRLVPRDGDGVQWAAGGPDLTLNGP